MTTEQRVHPRVPGGFYGDWRRASMPGALAAGYGIVGNLSVGGCFLEARDSLPPGARVRLQLDLPLAGWSVSPEDEVEGVRWVRFVIDPAARQERLQEAQRRRDRLPKEPKGDISL